MLALSAALISCIIWRAFVKCELCISYVFAHVCMSVRVFGCAYVCVCVCARVSVCALCKFVYSLFISETILCASCRRAVTMLMNKYLKLNASGRKQIK